MSEVKVNKLSPRSGTTVTLGDSGDTITIPSGVTLANSGTIDNLNASNLTSGTVPSARLSGAYTGITQTGTLTSFTSTGIDDNATSTAITINSSENVGIGTSSPTAKLEINAGDTFQQMKIRRGTGGTDAGIITFEQGDGTAVGHVGGVGSGGLQLRTGSGTGTERMRIDSSGNVGIGTSSPANKLHVLNASSGATYGADGADLFIIENNDSLRIDLKTTSSNTAGIMFSDSVRNVGALQYSHSADNMSFRTNSATRMTIDSSGRVLIATSSAIADAGDAKFQLSQGNANWINYSQNTNTSGNVFIQYLKFSGQSPDNNTSRFILCGDTTTQRFRVSADGDVQNHDNSYGAISDERIKQDIRDSNSQWNDIKSVRVRNFKKKDDVRQYGENAWEQIGVVAQELETISPKLIRHSEPSPSDILSDSAFGTLYQEGDEIPEGKNVGDVKEVHQQVKSVNYSILYMKSIKALQEAMERIETLETKNTELEARITALEANNP